jgi:hypothetical protein
LLLTHEQRLLKNTPVISTLPSSSFVLPVHPSSTRPMVSPLPQANSVTSYVLGPPPSTDTDLMTQFSAFLTSKGAWRDKINDKPSSDRFMCQMCQKKRHTADRCYKRFDTTYKPQPPRPSSKNRSYQSQALSVQPGLASPDTWYMDSGASAHVTSDLNAFTGYSPYTDPDQLHVGDGKGLAIIHTGYASLFTNSTPLVLNNVLHVPHISKPLLSISKPLADNHVYVKFHHNFCLVKDQTTHKVLLTSTNHNGLYLVASPPQALVCQKTSPQLWHQRLCARKLQLARYMFDLFVHRIN